MQLPFTTVYVLRRQGSTRYHAVPVLRGEPLSGTLCGMQAERWADGVGDAVTCPRCRKELMGKEEPGERDGVAGE